MIQNQLFTSAQITDQVSKISGSSTLKNSPILCQFLQFVVDETLEGKGERIKEYTIGTKVLGRKSDFDPQFDAIVRIHAGRLRRALNEFYLGPGKADELRISIPKGAYTPTFSINGSDITISEAPPRGHSYKLQRPVLAVMPFRNINNDASRDFFCQGLGEFLSTELAHFQELSILSYYSCLHAAGKTSDIHELHNLLGADYVLTGSVLMDKKKIRMLVQLSSKNGEQLWSNTFNRNISGNDFFEIQEEVVDQISAAVGGYYGVIYRDIAEASRLQPANDMATYDAIFWYHKFIKTLDKHTFDQACDALEDAVKNDPEYALAWAVLSEIYSVGISMGFNQLENQKEIAVNYAKRAVKLDPKSQHAYQALARAHFMTHNKAEVISACEKCIALNPRAVSYAARVGGMLIHVGEFERGASLLKESLLLNPFFPWMSSIALSLYHYQRNEFQESREWAAKVDMPQIPWVHLLKVACLGQLDRLDEAKIHIGKLLILKPTISALGKPHLSDYILHEKLVDKLIVGLEKAGLKIQKKVAHQLTVK